MNMEEERNKKKYKRLNLLFSLVGAVGSIFIAVSVTLIIYGFCFLCNKQCWISFPYCHYKLK